MALTLLNAASGNTNITFDGSSYKCITNRFEVDDVRQFTEATTLCSSKWVEETPARRQLFGTLIGFASKGDAISNPHTLIDEDETIEIVLTYDTDCTKTFDGYVSRSRTSVIATANGEQVYDFRSSGAVTTAWVVA
jgi:hypothetical protein